MKAIVYRKFWFLTGYQLHKIWRALLSSRPVCGGRWLKSVFLFLYHSNSISVAVLGSSYFDTCTLGLIYTASFFVANISIELSPVTLNCVNNRNNCIHLQSPFIKSSHPGLENELDTPFSINTTDKKFCSFNTNSSDDPLPIILPGLNLWLWLTSSYTKHPAWATYTRHSINP